MPEDTIRILIVDDEALVCWSLSRALQEEGYEVSTAQSGEEALNIMTEWKFDLVVTDLRLPQLNGMDLLREIKRRFPQCKVLMISAFGTPKVRDEAMREGVLQFFDKPFDIKELRESVRSALRTTNSAA